MKRQALVVLLAMSQLGCATLYGQTDGFRDKLDKGCHSITECKDLEAQAAARMASCEPNTFGRIRCDDAKADQIVATRMREAAEEERLQQEKQAEEAARAARDREEAEEERREAQRAAAEREVEAAKERQWIEQQAARTAEENMAACAQLDAKIAERKAEWQRRSDEIAAENERRRQALAWGKQHCHLSREAVTERRLGVDGQGVVRVQRQVVGRADVAVCPLSAPPDVVKFLDLEQDGGRLVTDWPLDVEMAVVQPFVPPTDRRCDR